LILDSNRNALIAMDLRVSIATLGIGVGALASGVFGMNVSRSFRPFHLALAASLSWHLDFTVDITHRVTSTGILLRDGDSGDRGASYDRSRITSPQTASKGRHQRSTQDTSRASRRSDMVTSQVSAAGEHAFRTRLHQQGCRLCSSP
jgi:hypothetical protein